VVGAFRMTNRFMKPELKEQTLLNENYISEETQIRSSYGNCIVPFSLDFLSFHLLSSNEKTEIYKTIISLVMDVKHSPHSKDLRMSKNRWLRKICGLKNE
jgi:hypothetical protein